MWSAASIPAPEYLNYDPSVFRNMWSTSSFIALTTPHAHTLYGTSSTAGALSGPYASASESAGFLPALVDAFPQVSIEEDSEEPLLASTTADRDKSGPTTVQPLNSQMSEDYRDKRVEIKHRSLAAWQELAQKHCDEMAALLIKQRKENERLLRELGLSSWSSAKLDSWNLCAHKIRVGVGSSVSLII